MHIPDGYLSPQTYLPLYGVSAVFWTASLKKLKKELSSRNVPYLAMAAAFSFLIQMFNVPVPGGSTGHAVGAAAISLLLGPWVTVVSVSIVLFVQAIVFGDGGITALGANCLNMAVIMPFVSYAVFRLIAGKTRAGKRLFAASFLSGYVGLLASAVATAVELGIQPLIATSADGRPLYAPYPLEIAVPAMALEHLALFSIIEGLLTGLVLKYLAAHEPDLVYALKSRDGGVS